MFKSSLNRVNIFVFTAIVTILAFFVLTVGGSKSLFAQEGSDKKNQQEGGKTGTSTKKDLEKKKKDFQTKKIMIFEKEAWVKILKKFEEKIYLDIAAELIKFIQSDKKGFWKIMTGLKINSFYPDPLTDEEKKRLAKTVGKENNPYAIAGAIMAFYVAKLLGVEKLPHSIKQRFMDFFNKKWITLKGGLENPVFIAMVKKGWLYLYKQIVFILKLRMFIVKFHIIEKLRAISKEKEKEAEEFQRLADEIKSELKKEGIIVNLELAKEDLENLKKQKSDILSNKEYKKLVKKAKKELGEMFRDFLLQNKKFIKAIAALVNVSMKELQLKIEKLGVDALIKIAEAIVGLAASPTAGKGAGIFLGIVRHLIKYIGVDLPGKKLKDLQEKEKKEAAKASKGLMKVLAKLFKKGSAKIDLIIRYALIEMELEFVNQRLKKIKKENG